MHDALIEASSKLKSFAVMAADSEVRSAQQNFVLIAAIETILIMDGLIIGCESVGTGPGMHFSFNMIKLGSGQFCEHA